MSKSAITIDGDLLDNPHAGDILASEFMEPLGLTADTLAMAIEVPVGSVADVLAGAKSVDGELDLRLGRYFGMSDGFFLRLQNSYDIEEAKRSRGAMIERITRRAA